MEREQKVSSIFILKTNAWNIYLTKNEDSSSKKRQRNIVNYLSHSDVMQASHLLQLNRHASLVTKTINTSKRNASTKQQGVYKI